MKNFNQSRFRQQFPILERKVNDKPLVYLDNAATSQKPDSVVQAIKEYLLNSNANVHRASHALSSQATKAFEYSRELVRNFINAASTSEIIWTKGATESINLVAQTWGHENLSEGDEIVVSYAEHHANIVPWQIIAQLYGATIKVMPLTEQGVIDARQLEHYIGKRTKFVAVSQISNVVGKQNPLKEIIKKAHDVGALVLIDGAQAVAHQPIDVQALDCDFFVFSGHKMYGPTGVGCLYGKHDILSALPPYQTGGEMIDKVSFSGTTFNALPFKFEAGTPNISGVIALGKAITFLQENNHRKNYEKGLLGYCYQQLQTIDSLQFLVKGKPDIPIFSFTIAKQHNHDIASYLDACGIAVRSGHHCAMPLMEYLGTKGCIRISLSAYNTFEEVDLVVNAIKSFILGGDTESINHELHQSDEVLTSFSAAKSWDSKHRQIMMYGKNLARLPLELKTTSAEITGCESSAWLIYSINEQGRYNFKADSDAKVIRGLLYIVLAKFQGLTKEQIKAVDISAYFSELGLIQHLSPSRGNGLRAIVDKIRASAT